MIPVPHVEELYNQIVNGATTIDDTRFRDAGDPYRRAFELLRIIGEVDPGDTITEVPQPRGWGWLEFQPALARALASMQEDQYLILDVKFERTFVQFAAQGAHGMRAEASSNSVLPPQAHLTRPQLERLVELGWRAPTGSLDFSTPVNDPDGSPNFFLDLPADFDADRLAALAVDTFVEVLQVPHPGELTYSAWGHEGPIDLPELKLADEQRPAPPLASTPEPETPQSVREKVRAVISQLTRDEAVVEDDDGDFAVWVGSARVFVRVMDDMPALSVFSQLLTGVRATPDTLAEINRINSQLRFVKLFVVGDTVVAAHELHVDPFDWSRVHQAIVGVLHLADDLDNELQQKIGGTLSTGESRNPDRPSAGYL